MTGLRIVLFVLAAAGALLGYVLWPSSQDLDRRAEPIDQHRTALETVLAECKELVQYFDQRKPTHMKKKELQDLRDRLAALEEKERTFLEDDSAELDRRERRVGLDVLEEEFYSLLRDGEDLRARLREMKKYKDQLEPKLAKTGRLMVKLLAAQQASEDILFRQRSNEIIDKSKTVRNMAERAMQELAFSILRGRTIAQTALNELDEVNKGMKELVDLAGASPARPKAGEEADG